MRSGRAAERANRGGGAERRCGLALQRLGDPEADEREPHPEDVHEAPTIELREHGTRLGLPDAEILAQLVEVRANPRVGGGAQGDEEVVGDRFGGGTW